MPKRLYNDKKCFGFSCGCIAKTECTNTAARVTPMKISPNVFPRSICGRRSCGGEDMVDRPIPQ
jgi:hypothetical protein